tara:strand:- start:408 stop:584 length:177 start_codon:yes stop_codon:yes gene_type:complete
MKATFLESLAEQVTAKLPLSTLEFHYKEKLILEALKKAYKQGEKDTAKKISPRRLVSK